MFIRCEYCIYPFQWWQRICSNCRSYNQASCSLNATYWMILTSWVVLRLATWRVPYVPPNYLISYFFVGLRVTLLWFSMLCFVNCCLSVRVDFFLSHNVGILFSYFNCPFGIRHLSFVSEITKIYMGLCEHIENHYVWVLSSVDI